MRKRARACAGPRSSRERVCETNHICRFVCTPRPQPSRVQCVKKCTLHPGPHARASAIECTYIHTHTPHARARTHACTHEAPHGTRTAAISVRIKFLADETEPIGLLGAPSPPSPFCATRINTNCAARTQPPSPELMFNVRIQWWAGLFPIDKHKRGCSYKQIFRS